MNAKIECEEVVVKVPKLIMKFLREQERILEEKTEEYLQRCIVGVVAADIESQETFVPSAIDMANKYNLQPIFKAFDVAIFDPDC